MTEHDGDETGTTAQVAPALRHAVTTEDWRGVALLLEHNWSILVAEDPALLLEGIAALPAEMVRAAPRWVAARGYLEHLLRGADAVHYRDAMPAVIGGRLVDVLAEHTSRSAGRRSRGQFAQAAREARRAREVLDSASDSQRVLAQYSLPPLLVQWGRSHELAGDLAAARVEYLDAYDLARIAADPLVVAHAAGRLAWLEALTGRRAAAWQWIARTGERPAAAPEAALARALLESDAMLSARAEQTVRRLREPGAASGATPGGSSAPGLTAVDVDAVPPASAPPAARSRPQARSRARAHAESWAALLFVRAQLATVDTAAALHDDLVAAVESRPRDLSTSGVNGLYIAHAAARLDLLRDRAADAPAGPAPWDEDGLPAVRIATAQLALARAADDTVLEHTRSIRRELDGSPRWNTLRLVAESQALRRLGRAREADAAASEALDSIVRHGLFAALTHAPHGGGDSHDDGDDDGEGERMLGALPARIRAEVLRRSPRPSASPAWVRAAALTARERSVLLMLPTGASVDEIARQSYVTRNTIKSQLRAIYRKLGISSRPEAEALARSLRDSRSRDQPPSSLPRRRTS